VIFFTFLTAAPQQTAVKKTGAKTNHKTAPSQNFKKSQKITPEQAHWTKTTEWGESTN
jgi:hypothetical protein